MNSAAPSVRFHGELDHPVHLTVAQLRDLTERRADVTFDCRSSGPQHHVFEGPSLWDVLNSAQLRVDLGRRKERLRHVLAVTGADGHFAVLSLAEIDPEFGNQRMLLATSIDGHPLDQAGPQLVVPDDVCGARYVSGITTVWVGALDRGGLPTQRVGTVASAVPAGPSAPLRARLG